MKKILITMFVIALGAVGMKEEVKAQAVVKVRPVKPKVVVVRPAKAPRNGVVWVDGHWKWSRRTRSYVWTKGRWATPPRGKVWIAGKWVRRSNGWVYRAGRWG